ncbi:MAG: hypothetical protein K6T83_01785 [Alicyclobacillus sp.]|nr:hypothetical protein [Alicyclobacillus sp.]
MGDQTIVHGIPVYGVNVDSQTRCQHYHLDIDVIAIKFPCCGRYYPCHLCHAELADHPAEQWTVSDFTTKAILCGCCGEELAIEAYLSCTSTCPACGAAFNPGCRKHGHLYFQLDKPLQDVE